MYPWWRHTRYVIPMTSSVMSPRYESCNKVTCLWQVNVMLPNDTWRLNLAPKQWGWDWIWILTAYQSALKCKLRTDTKAVGTTIQIGIWEQSSWALHRNVIGRPKQSQVRWWLGYRLRQLILEGWYIFIQGTGIVMLPLWKLSHNYTMKFIYNG